MIIDFTTTATRRPEILSRTYNSFISNLKGFDISQSTLYINIDPIPTNTSTETVIKAANAFFPRVVTNTPQSPSFPAAIKWCWTQPTNKYFFHLEDDWTLSKEINLNDLIKIFEDDKTNTLACINLRAYHSIQDDRICLSPGLWQSDISKILANRLSINANPEKQLRPKDGTNPDGDKHTGYAGIQYGNKPIIIDIGRAWLNQKSKPRKDKGIFFTKWIEQAEPRIEPQNIIVPLNVTKPKTYTLKTSPKPIGNIPKKPSPKPNIISNKIITPAKSMKPLTPRTLLWLKPVKPR